VVVNTDGTDLKSERGFDDRVAVSANIALAIRREALDTTAFVTWVALTATIVMAIYADAIADTGHFTVAKAFAVSAYRYAGLEVCAGGTESAREYKVTIFTFLAA